MEPREEALERRLGCAVGAPLRLAVADAPLDEKALSPTEARRFAQLTRERRPSWLTGRAALKRLFRACGEPEDTSSLEFPHPCVALTHSGERAVALKLLSPVAQGVGIDLEASRAPSPASARFFLAPAEQHWLRTLRAAKWPTELLRLWTVKEALFKADPQNHETWLSDYCLTLPALRSGRASMTLRARRLWMRYASIRFERGWLSVAVSSMGSPQAEFRASDPPVPGLQR